MERVALVGGIILAAFFAFGSMVHIDFDFDDWDGGRPAAYVEPAPERRAEETFDANTLRIRAAAAIIRIIAEDRRDIAAGFDNPGAVPSPVLNRRGRTLTIDGRLSGRIRECHEDGAVTLRDYGRIPHDRLPVITIRAPRDLDLDLGGALYADIGASDSLEFHYAGCGFAEAGDIAGPLELHVSGPGNVRIGRSESADLSVAGSGNVTLGATGSLDASIGGSGAVRVAAAEGDADVKIAGSADFILDGGALDTADFNVAGSGSMDIVAPVRRLETAVNGSGSVIVRRPVNEFEARLVGSGAVTLIARPPNTETTTIGSGALIIEPSAVTPPERPTPPAPPSPVTPMDVPSAIETPTPPAAPPQPPPPPTPGKTN